MQRKKEEEEKEVQVGGVSPFKGAGYYGGPAHRQDSLCKGQGCLEANNNHFIGLTGRHQSLLVTLKHASSPRLTPSSPAAALDCRNTVQEWSR